MLKRLSELEDVQITCDAGIYGIKDVLLADSLRKLRYFFIDTSHATAPDWSIVAARRVEKALSPELIELDLTEDHLSSAPHWSGDPDLFDRILANLPPLVIGPFGNTHAPLPMAASAGMLGDAEDSIEDPRVKPLLKHHVRGSELLEVPVFGADGPLGTVSDLVIDLLSLDVTHLVVTPEDAADDEPRLLSIDALRHRAEGDSGHLVFRLSSEEFLALPRIGSDTPLSDVMTAPAFDEAAQTAS